MITWGSNPSVFLSVLFHLLCIHVLFSASLLHRCLVSSRLKDERCPYQNWAHIRVSDIVSGFQCPVHSSIFTSRAARQFPSRMSWYLTHHMFLLCDFIVPYLLWFCMSHSLFQVSFPTWFLSFATWSNLRSRCWRRLLHANDFTSSLQLLLPNWSYHLLCIHWVLNVYTFSRFQPSYFSRLTLLSEILTLDTWILGFWPVWNWCLLIPLLTLAINSFHTLPNFSHLICISPRQWSFFCINQHLEQHLVQGTKRFSVTNFLDVIIYVLLKMDQVFAHKIKQGPLEKSMCAEELTWQIWLSQRLWSKRVTLKHAILP